MPTIEQLHIFVATVETGSFSAAARRLGKAQSAVSQQIINMEIDCNQTLFDRSGRYPKLTAAGESLLEHAKAVLAQHQRLLNQMVNLGTNTPKRFSLAIDEGVPYSGLTKQLLTLEQHYPQLQLEILTATSQDIIRLVTAQRVDMGVIFSMEQYPQKIDFEALGAVNFEPLASTSHPLAQLNTAHIDMLKLHRQLVIGAKDTEHNGYKLEHSPDVWYADNYYVLLELTKAGFGWALLPEHLALNEIDKQQLCRIPMAFEQFGWVANVDVVQHHGVNGELSKLLRLLLKNMMSQS